MQETHRIIWDLGNLRHSIRRVGGCHRGRSSDGTYCMASRHILSLKYKRIPKEQGRATRTWKKKQRTRWTRWKRRQHYVSHQWGMM
jgi:hypothetical protein